MLRWRLERVWCGNVKPGGRGHAGTVGRRLTNGMGPGGDSCDPYTEEDVCAVRTSLEAAVWCVTVVISPVARSSVRRRAAPLRGPLAVAAVKGLHTARPVTKCMAKLQTASGHITGGNSVVSVVRRALNRTCKLPNHRQHRATHSTGGHGCRLSRRSLKAACKGLRSPEHSCHTQRTTCRSKRLSVAGREALGSRSATCDANAKQFTVSI